MNFFAFSSILIIVTTLPLLFLVIVKGPKKSQFIWILFFLSVAGWGLGGYKIATAVTEQDAFKWWQMAWISAIMTPVFYYHWMYVYLKTNKKFDTLILYVSYFLAFIFIAFDLFAKELYLGGVKFVFNQFYWLDWYKHKSILFVIFYILMYWLLLLYAFSLLIIRFKHSKGIERNQIKYLILGSLCGWIGPFNHFLISFGINIYPYTNISLVFYPMFFAYGIIK